MSVIASKCDNCFCVNKLANSNIQSKVTFMAHYAIFFINCRAKDIFVC